MATLRFGVLAQNYRCLRKVSYFSSIKTSMAKTTVEMKTGERQIARFSRRRPDFREKSHTLIPKLTYVKTPLTKTTVKTKTGERQIARFPRRRPDFWHLSQKSRFSEKMAFSGKMAVFRKNVVFPENGVFPDFRQNFGSSAISRKCWPGNRNRLRVKAALCRNRRSSRNSRMSEPAWK